MDKKDLQEVIHEELGMSLSEITKSLKKEQKDSSKKGKNKLEYIYSFAYNFIFCGFLIYILYLMYLLTNAMDINMFY